LPSITDRIPQVNARRIPELNYADARVESAVGKFEKYVGVTWTIKRAVTGQISTPQLMPDVVDADGQLSGQEILPVPTHGLIAPEIQWVRIAPFRRARHHYCFSWEL
jgi:hypothetical protein